MTHKEFSTSMLLLGWSYHSVTYACKWQKGLDHVTMSIEPSKLPFGSNLYGAFTYYHTTPRGSVVSNPKNYNVIIETAVNYDP